ncbi:succinylglutamate desuccinylase [Burkholderia pseudomallei]|nr:succinylglutamate desuccinylase [Burkholderia pseudomallei]
MPRAAARRTPHAARSTPHEARSTKHEARRAAPRLPG